MKKRLAAIGLALMVTASACSHEKKAGFEIQPGSDVTLEKKDGVKVVGRLVEVQPEQVVVETREGRTSVPRADIAALRATAIAPAASGNPPVGASGNAAPERRDPPAAARETSAAPERTQEFRTVTAPAGTILLAELATPVSSETSKVEDPVRATLRQPLRVGGQQVLPAGTTIVGHVTGADRSARVKGRASVRFRFTAIDVPGDAGRVAIRTDAVSRRAPATKKQDAAKIGGGAAGGALIGAIVGGGDGAAKGAAIGGAAGTGVVLSTRGKEVQLAPGADISVRLAAPVTFRVPVR